jgi:hypothetical protein
MQNAGIIGLAHELSMKTPNWIKTGLMAAFHARDVDPRMSVKNCTGRISANS